MSYFITIHTVITPAHMGRLQQIPLNEFKKVLKNKSAWVTLIRSRGLQRSFGH